MAQEANTPAEKLEQPQPLCSTNWKQERQDALTKAQSLLCPADRDLLIKGLTTALALVVPTGFSVQDRKLWLAVACETLKDLPLDLLQRGVKHARLVADHPSKIVPAIVAEVGAELESRRVWLRLAEKRMSEPEPERTLPPTEARPLTADEIRAMGPDLRRIGLKQGFITQEEIDAALIGD